MVIRLSYNGCNFITQRSYILTSSFDALRGSCLDGWWSDKRGYLHEH